MDSILWDILGLKGLVSHMLIQFDRFGRFGQPTKSIIVLHWKTSIEARETREKLGLNIQKTCLVASSYPKGMLVSWASNPELESANQM
jgi:hypothetical protein